MGQSLRLLLPEAEVTFQNIYKLSNTHGGMEAFIVAHRDFDVILASSIPANSGSPSDPTLLGPTPRTVLLPNIFFPAFHPDLVYVGDVDGPPRGQLESPVGPYHSALALYGFRRGASVEDTLGLFRREVYARVGYLDAWPGATKGLSWLAGQAGWEIGPDLARWSRRGAFMHSPNHPRMFVAADIARSFLRKAGIAFDDFDIEPYLHDELLAQGSWPVYPEIGELYGLAGAYVFLPRSRRGRRQPEPLTLRRFVEGSFAIYRRRSASDLACARVEAWLVDETLARDLRDHLHR